MVIVDGDVMCGIEIVVTLLVLRETLATTFLNEDVGWTDDDSIVISTNVYFHIRQTMNKQKQTHTHTHRCADENK